VGERDPAVVEVAETSCPLEKLRIALAGRGKDAQLAERPAERVLRSGDVRVLVRVDAHDHAFCAGDCEARQPQSSLLEGLFRGRGPYSVDEKSQVQALARSQPAFPMMPNMPERRTHDYVRHGTTSLFGAFNCGDGSVISSLHRRHRSIEFKKFLAKIDATVPEGLEVHLVCDNYGTHKSPAVRTWLGKHPRFHVHYTPTYSSWINQVERFFAYISPPRSAR